MLLRGTGFGTSQVVQWLRLCISIAGAAGFIPGQEAKVSYVMWYNKEEEWVLSKGRGCKSQSPGYRNHHLPTKQSFMIPWAACVGFMLTDNVN